MITEIKHIILTLRIDIQQNIFVYNKNGEMANRVNNSFSVVANGFLYVNKQKSLTNNLLIIIN